MRSVLSAVWRARSDKVPNPGRRGYTNPERKGVEDYYV